MRLKIGGKNNGENTGLLFKTKEKLRTIQPQLQFTWILPKKKSVIAIPAPARMAAGRDTLPAPVRTATDRGTFPAPARRGSIPPLWAGDFFWVGDLASLFLAGS